MGVLVSERTELSHALSECSHLLKSCKSAPVKPQKFCLSHEWACPEEQAGQAPRILHSALLK